VSNALLDVLLAHRVQFVKLANWVIIFLEIHALDALNIVLSVTLQLIALLASQDFILTQHRIHVKIARLAKDV
jgi:hypothetical protein